MAMFFACARRCASRLSRARCTEVPSWHSVAALVVLCAAVAAAADEAAAAVNSKWQWMLEEVRIPETLECDADPEWRSFRRASREAFFAPGGPRKDAALQAQAAALEEKWRPWACTQAEGQSVCPATSADLNHNFVKELDVHCRDSNNFERYLIRHYFHNTKKDFQRLEEPSGFCLYGYATCLAVLAWHALPEQVGEGLRYLYSAHNLIGHYHSFDYFESSSWPVSSFLFLLNMQHGENTFMPLLDPPEYDHPGSFGTKFYYDRLKWEGTIEAVKAERTGFLTGASRLPFAWPGTRKRIVVWQFCIHTSTAGEAVTMISRFLSKEVEVVWKGNSVAHQLCGNYDPSLCAPPENVEFIDWLADRFEKQDMPYGDIVQKFTERLLPQLMEADVWMCSIPAIWCQLLADVGRGGVGQSAPLAKPIFVYLGLPIHQYVGRDQRLTFLREFARLAEDPRSVVVANNAYLSEEVFWQTGLRVPTLRIHGLHTNATYMPLRNSEVMIQRPGTSGGWQECLLRRFEEANPAYPVRFVQFTDLLNPHTKKEVYNMSLSYKELGKFRALVSFPYDTSLMLFWEFYSMNVPTFVPFQLWHWGIFGQHTRPDLEHPMLEEKERLTVDMGTAFQHHVPPHSPFFDGFQPLDLTRSVYWSKFTDWAMFPHIQYFRSLPDLMVKLVSDDLPAISASMKRFNEESIVHTVAAWRLVVQHWAHWSSQ
eukprot:TRINITY_DN26074_c0_g1_i1.p1 TRINITY_DN26074_c0_g1~~TRINITY_DN26074_c0_g1_i1.p1  ORF type:complete len:710 (+),score=117.28 TRINITY_DN26074_c0_g1_i1:76-2205(+)